MLRLSFFYRCASLSLAGIYGKHFTVSPRTWRRITEINDAEGFANDERFLRLAIDAGGCHGYLYKFAFEPKSELNKDEDIVVKESDVAQPGDEGYSGAQPSPQLVVDRISLTKLEKAVLDYHSELKGSAFVVVGNELVDQSCACALSFSIRKKGASNTSQTPLRGAGGAKGTAIHRG